MKNNSSNNSSEKLKERQKKLYDIPKDILKAKFLNNINPK